MKTAKFKFTETYTNGKDTSIIIGYLTVKYTLSDEELDNILCENSIYLEGISGIVFFDFDWVNDEYDCTFEKLE